MSKELVFFLEEKSAKNTLEQIWLKLVPSESGITPRFVAFDGKQDLEKQLPRKMSRYINPDARFIVLRDQDSGDCGKIKNRLTALCESNCRGRPFLVRIACRELESWFLAQLGAVERGLGVGSLTQLQQKASYRNPDAMVGPSRELEKITAGRYEKGLGSRSIAPHLDPNCTRSPSFMNLVQAIRRLCQDF